MDLFYLHTNYYRKSCEELSFTSNCWMCSRYRIQWPTANCWYNCNFKQTNYLAIPALNGNISVYVDRYLFDVNAEEIQWTGLKLFTPCNYMIALSLVDKKKLILLIFSSFVSNMKLLLWIWISIIFLRAIFVLFHVSHVFILFFFCFT